MSDSVDDWLKSELIIESFIWIFIFIGVYLARYIGVYHRIVGRAAQGAAVGALLRVGPLKFFLHFAGQNDIDLASEICFFIRAKQKEEN